MQSMQEKGENTLLHYTKKNKLMRVEKLKALPSGLMQQHEEPSTVAATQKRDLLAKLFSKIEG